MVGWLHHYRAITAHHFHQKDFIMGYMAHTLSSDFTVPAEKTKDALNALTASPAWEHRSIKGGEESDTLMTALDRFGFEVDAGYENPDDVVITNYNDKYGDEIVAALEALAPFAIEGTGMQWQGEDNTFWEMEVKDGALDYKHGDLTYS